MGGGVDGIPLHVRCAPGSREGGGQGRARADRGIVGNEGLASARSSTRSRETRGVPLAHGADRSIVAVAAGILLYEVLRGR